MCILFLIGYELYQVSVDTAAATCLFSRFWATNELPIMIDELFNGGALLPWRKEMFGTRTFIDEVLPWRNDELGRRLARVRRNSLCFLGCNGLWTCGFLLAAKEGKLRYLLLWRKEEWRTGLDDALQWCNPRLTAEDDSGPPLLVNRSPGEASVEVAAIDDIVGNSGVIIKNCLVSDCNMMMYRG